MSAPVDLDALQKVAEAATQDFWWHDLVGSPFQRPEEQEWMVDSNPNFICSTHIGTKRGENDAAHIAAFDPPTALALLDRLNAAEAKLQRVAAIMADWRQGGVDSAEASDRISELLGIEEGN